MDASLAPLYEEVATTRCGKSIDVTLARRLPTSTGAPCEEVLCVRVVRAAWSHADLEAYVRFHRGYVLDRARGQWPHRYALVYDITALEAPRDVPTFLADMAIFVDLQNECGDHYIRWMHKAIVAVRNADVAAVVNGIMALSGPTARPVVAHMPTPGATVAERLARDENPSPPIKT